ncbi:MAG: TIR domain-containing protein [Candidatus Lokiarchaeota archaeon]|nr:TIR domain-containing protein [Candidatus Lokiarchaeota archaeon]
MSEVAHFDLLKASVEQWNKWRIEHPDRQPSLRKVNLADRNLRRVNLKGADLMGADLSHADLSGADLSNVSFNDSNLSGANLEHTKLNATLFIEAILDDTSMDNAELNGTDFTRANLRRASLRGARLYHAVFADADLSSAKGLTQCIHDAPSSIDSLTLSRSGNLPDAFLRGCGLPDWLIEAYALMQPHLSNEEVVDIAYRLCNKRINQVMQLSPVFISYSQADALFVDLIAAELDKRGIRYWRDIHHAPAGRLERIIDHAIRLNPMVLVILSRNSVNSDWVEHEVRQARKLEKELQRDVICPIALDDSWKHSKWPARLREQIEEYNILDFSNWSDSVEFIRMFERLLHGMAIYYEPADVEINNSKAV